MCIGCILAGLLAATSWTVGAIATVIRRARVAAAMRAVDQSPRTDSGS